MQGSGGFPPQNVELLTQLLSLSSGSNNRRAAEKLQRSSGGSGAGPGSPTDAHPTDCPGGIRATCGQAVARCPPHFSLQERADLPPSLLGSSEFHFTCFVEKKKGKVKFLCLHGSVCAIVPGGTGAPAARHSPALSRTPFTP